MARKALIEKARKTPKFAVRKRNRCELCGRARGYMRMFELCRLCFRERALKGVLPGVKKASW
jgi:small subunit ribosomal protein S14